MTKILFICHGNICRSPMAQFVFQHLLGERGIAENYRVDSCAISREELGNGLYPPARKILNQKGIPCLAHTARQVTKQDYEKFDLLVAMEAHHITSLARIFGGDRRNKCRLLLSFAGENRDIEDPWYTGNFESVYNDIEKGCKALLRTLEESD